MYPIIYFELVIIITIHMGCTCIITVNFIIKKMSHLVSGSILFYLNKFKGLNMFTSEVRQLLSLRPKLFVMFFIFRVKL